MKKLALISLLAISSCTLEPSYHTPPHHLPLAENSQQKISEVSWDKFFESPDLQRVIKMALENNRDLKVANLNVESLEAVYGVARASLFPSISANGAETRQKAPAAFKAFTPKRQYRANLAFTAYELDFWGRLRSLKKSAQEDLLSSREARNLVKITVISATVNAYAQFLADRENLRIAEDNLKTLESRSHFVEVRRKAGLDSQQDYLLALFNLENARNTYENYRKYVEQDSNALMILTGKFSAESLPKVNSIDDIKINESLIEFVPSTSLLSRPDIKQAEHDLKGANADIGAARAAFFPNISLSGTYGYGSRDLSTLFDSRTWTLTPQITMPIFAGGQNIARLKNANIQKQIEIINYEKAIHTAFREALDQFAEYESISNQLKSADKILKTQNKSFQIAVVRYQRGASNSLNKIDSQLLLLSARQNYVNVKKEYLANIIALYKVLGGGNDLEEERDDSFFNFL